MRSDASNAEIRSAVLIYFPRQRGAYANTLSRMRSLKTIPLLLAIAVVATSATPVAETQPRGAAPMPAAGAFRHAVNQFIEAQLKLYPVRATALGDHRFDARVNDDSTTGIAQIARQQMG